MLRLVQAHRPGPVALGLLALAAVAVGIAGFEHARLFHRGYAHVEVVGPLFLLDAIGSTVVIGLLIFDRVALFVAGTLSLCIPSVISIVLSHSSTGFLGFREGGYDAAATLILAAEAVAVVLAVLGAAATASGGARPARAPS